jgi:hypothetical protein
MMSCLLAAWVAVQFAPPEAKTESRRDTYIIMLQNGEKLPVFLDQAEKKGNNVIRVEVDEPWYQPPRYRMVKTAEIVEQSKERPSVRDQRIRDGWRANGFTEVNGKQVPTAEVEWAQAARRLAGVTDTLDRPVSPDSSSGDAAPPVSPVGEAAPGFPAQWGAHIGIVVAAILLLVLVARTLVFPGNP